MIDIDQQGSNKVRISDNPAAAPGKCVVCGYTGGDTGGTRMFIDIGLDIDFYGVVYFCTDCMDSTAEILGYITPSRAEQLETANAQMSLRIGELEIVEAKLNELRTVIWPDIRVLPDTSSDVLVNFMAPESDDDESDSESGDFDSAAKSTVIIEGPDDASTTASSNLTEFGL